MTNEGIERFLAQRIGLDPTTVGAGLLTRALNLRMAALGLGRREEYLRLLRESEREQEALVEEVVIPESWFFRDDRPFQRFREYVSARAKDPAAPPLRVLSIPCAGGEEPYSIAIALRELGLPPERWTVVAVDVSARALERAARGVFGENSFRGMDPALRARYFRPHPDGAELVPEIRESVRFLRGNLIDPALLWNEPPFDVIFCRNVLIYLDAPARQAAAHAFDRLLAPQGLLFLGHAERFENGETRFEPVRDQGGFAYRRVPAPVRLTAPAVASPSRRPRHRAPEPARPPQRAAREAEPPISLDEAALLADQGKNAEAAALCEQFLRASGPSARAYFLLGLIRQAAGDSAQAESFWQKTVYLDPQHDEALLALALSAERRGDRSASAGYRRRAERALRRASHQTLPLTKGESEGVPGGPGPSDREPPSIPPPKGGKAEMGDTRRKGTP